MSIHNCVGKISQVLFYTVPFIYRNLALIFFVADANVVKLWYVLYVDINECESSPCHPNATCQNTEGSFMCNCDNNFEGDGFSCTRRCDNGFQLPAHDSNQCGRCMLGHVVSTH